MLLWPWSSDLKMYRGHLLTTTNLPGYQVPWLPLLNFFKILSGHGFCIKCYCDLDLWPSDLKMYWGHLLMTTNLSTKYHDCHSLTFQDIERTWCGKRTDRRTDGQTERRTKCQSTMCICLYLTFKRDANIYSHWTVLSVV